MATELPPVSAAAVTTAVDGTPFNMRRAGVGMMLVAAGATGCGGGAALDLAEVVELLNETVMFTRAVALSTTTIVVGSSFAVGQTPAEAAIEIADIMAAELPCAEASVDGATVVVEYGATADCSFEGQSITGEQRIEIASAAAPAAVAHAWTELSNGVYTVDGRADVAFSSLAAGVTVDQELAWRRLVDGRTASGNAALVFAVSEADIAAGMELGGTATWQGRDGTWTMAIRDAELDWSSPLPTDGVYEVDTPFDGKRATIAFAAHGDETIEIAIETGGSTYTFDVGVSATPDQG